MAVPIQLFGTLLPNPEGDEILPVVAPDGLGGYTDHHVNLAAIAALAETGDVIGVIELSPQGLYSPAATYSQFDTVRYNSAGTVGTYLHWSDTESVGILPTDSNRWMLLANDGSDGADGSDGIDGAPGADGADGSDGAPGADGSDGIDGIAIGSQCIYTTGTVDANGEIGGTSTLSINQNDRNGTLMPLSGILTGSVIFIQDEANSANYSTYTLTADLVLAGPIYSAAATVASGGVIADAASVRVLIERRGADGSDGIDGAPGADGADGSDGAQGPAGSVSAASGLILDESTAPSTGTDQIAIFADVADGKLKQRAENNGAITDIGAGGVSGGSTDILVQDLTGPLTLDNTYSALYLNPNGASRNVQLFTPTADLRIDLQCTGGHATNGLILRNNADTTTITTLIDTSGQRNRAILSFDLTANSWQVDTFLTTRFASAISGGGGGDPLFANVLHLLQMGANNQSPITDIKGASLTLNGGIDLVTGGGYFSGSNHVLFDGTDDYIGWTGAANAFNGDFTIEAAIYPTSVSTELEIFSIISGTSTNVSLEVNTGGILRGLLRDDAGNTLIDLYSPANALVANTYQFVQMIVSGNTLTLGVNGVSVASGTIVGTRQGSFTNYQIGRLISTVPRFFSGRISSFRMTNAARTLSVPSVPFPSA